MASEAIHGAALHTQLRSARALVACLILFAVSLSPLTSWSTASSVTLTVLTTVRASSTTVTTTSYNTLALDTPDLSSVSLSSLGDSSSTSFPLQFGGSLWSVWLAQGCNTPIGSVLPTCSAASALLGMGIFIEVLLVGTLMGLLFALGSTLETAIVEYVHLCAATNVTPPPALKAYASSSALGAARAAPPAPPHGAECCCSLSALRRTTAVQGALVGVVAAAAFVLVAWAATLASALNTIAAFVALTQSTASSGGVAVLSTAGPATVRPGSAYWLVLFAGGIALYTLLAPLLAPVCARVSCTPPSGAAAGSSGALPGSTAFAQPPVGGVKPPQQQQQQQQHQQQLQHQPVPRGAFLVANPLATERPLPAGWRMLASDGGEPYFLNERDGRTQWERPAECTQWERPAE